MCPPVSLSLKHHPCFLNLPLCYPADRTNLSTAKHFVANPCCKLLFESTEPHRHNGWELGVIGGRLDPRDSVLLCEHRFLDGIHDEAGAEEDAKQLMQGAVEVPLQP